MISTNDQGRLVLVVASAVSMVLGSIHAFSVFLVPLETAFNTSRATASLVYSFSLLFLTLAVLFGPTVYSRLRPSTIYLLVAFLGSSGAGLAGSAERLEFVFVGYSLVFGVANGLGYGFGLQFSARVNPDHPGLAMGVVTAAYAFGAVLAPYGFELALTFSGFLSAMLVLGSMVFLVGIAAALLIACSGAQYSDEKIELGVHNLPWGRIATIWLAYGTGVAAGLMAIGHAAGIAATANFPGWIAAVAIAGCNLLGSLLCGWLSDRVSHRSILAALASISALALLAIIIVPALTIPFLGIVGFAYGGAIASYPAAIAALFPGESGPRAYGLVFTAWGAAGLLAPWPAGQIFDWAGSYTLALWIAAGLGVISAVSVRTFLR